jgi:predicted nucleotidyltransferase
VYNTRMQRISIAPKQLQDFCQRYHVQRLAMFGSMARGTAHPQSDVDLLVTFQPDAHIGLITFSKMQRELSDMFHRRVDSVPQDGLKPVIRDSILADAQELYAA